MGLLSTLISLGVGTGLAHPAQSYAFTRGDPSRSPGALLCSHCGQVVAANRSQPTAVNRTCRCGKTTPSTWPNSTRRIFGSTCRCGQTLFYGEPSPNIVTCVGGGRHTPQPLYQTDFGRH
jgi:hypothetical protein